MVLTLYKLDASPPARAAMLVIKALNIPDVEYIDVNLFEKDHFKDEFLKMNPQHTIPVLKDDDFVIWDSHAIAAYLTTKYDGQHLYPTDLKQRAIVDQRLHFDSGILFPTLRGTLEPVLFWGQKSFNPKDLEKIKKAYDLAETLFTSTWIAGNDLTIADICCYASISTLNIITPVDEAVYPNMKAWMDRCSQMELFKETNEPGVNLLARVVKVKLA